MKTWKFLLTFFAASLMSTSQLAWAAGEVKSQQLREQVLPKGANYLQYAEKKPVALDGESQEIMQQWLSHFGHEKIPSVEVQKVSDKKGHNSIRFITTHDGQSYTISVEENDNQNIWINGQKISLEDARNLPTLMAKLAEKDSALKPLAKSLAEVHSQNETDKMFLSTEQFLQLSDLKKVEYLSLLRQVNEAASTVDRVHNHLAMNKAARGSLFAFNPLFLTLMAFAESVPPADGDECIVAGNLSIYESRVCVQRPKLETLKQKVPEGSYLRKTIGTMMDASDQCPAGKDTACNPLVYGYDQSGTGFKPICLDSKTNPKDFTEHATQHCNERSPIGEKGSIERRAAFARILKTYLGKKEGKNIADYASCFNEKNEVRAGECKKMFKPQLDGFKEFYSKSLAICRDMKREDQKKACEELRKRALDLKEFTDEEPLPPATDEDQKAACLRASATWNEATKTCWCSLTIKASENGARSGTNVREYTCSYPVSGGTADPKDLPPQKDKCTKEDGSKSHSFSCSPGLWIGGIIGIGLIAWLFNRGNSSNPTPAPVLTEGGSGSSGGVNGGARTTTTTLAPAVSGSGTH